MLAGTALVKTFTEQVRTLDERSEHLKFSKSTFYKLAQSRLVLAHKVGQHWRFRRETINR